MLCLHPRNKSMFFFSIFCCSDIFVTIWESRLHACWFHFLEFPHMSNLQIKSERIWKIRDDARIKISSPAGFQYWQMSQNTPSSHFFTTLLHIFHRIFSYSGCRMLSLLLDRLNLFLSTPIWFWIMFNLFCHYINSQYQ